MKTLTSFNKTLLNSINFKTIFSFIALICFTQIGFGQVFITELADPNNNLNARYVELYNAGESSVDLSTWRLDKYTNTSITVSQTLALTGTIAGGGFYIIATGPSDSVFFDVFGFTPDQWDETSNHVAGSNGDDKIALIDGTGTLVDIFGTPGSYSKDQNTAENFEDGRAERVSTITNANSTWTASEWDVDNDQGFGSGAQDAPGGFDPGVWIGYSSSEPEITLGAVSGNTSEDGTTATFTAVLNVAPTSDVVLDITSGDTAEVNVSPSTLTFTAANWDTPQTITSTGVDDSDQDGDINITITVAVDDAGSDAAYAGLSETITVTNEDNEPSRLIINEFLADPPFGVSGDANGDGARDGSDDEFVEIYNNTLSDIDVSGYKLNDSGSTRHVFPSETIVPSGEVIVVFGGGTPTNLPCIAQTASSGGLSLANIEDTISILDTSSLVVTSYSYGSEANSDQSLGRDLDITGDFKKHSEITGNPVDFSPGRFNETNIPFSCIAPKNLTTSNVSSTSTALSWDGVGADSYQVYVFETGADPTIATAVYTATVSGVTTDTATGLSSNTTYDFYVAAICTQQGNLQDTPAAFTSGSGCGDTAYDTGGVSGDYSNNENYTFTFTPDTPGDTVILDINYIEIESDFDFLSVYDGADVNAPQLDDEVTEDVTFTASTSAGLTIKFTSDISNTGAGWAATINCETRYNWAGTTSSDWATTSNWSTGVVPTSNDDVYIDGTFTNEPTISSTDAVALSVTIASGNTLTIDETSSLTVSGDFTNSGGIVTLNSTEDDFSSLIVTGTATGDITYNRYVNAYDTNPDGGGWDFVCSPVTMSIADFITANGAAGANVIEILGDDYAFASYDNEAGQWDLYATSNITCTTGGAETFTDIGSGSGYDDRSWTGDDGSTWTATNAIDGQTITGAAITLNQDTANTYVQSGTISGGICNITISTKRPFGSGSGTLDVLINGSSVGTVPYSGSVQTTTISDINITGDIVIRIDNNIGGSNGGGFERVTIDDVTWTAATPQDLGSFTTGQGYAMATNAGDGATVAFTGAMQTADQSIDIINNNGVNGVGRRWNLVSNPFPSYINGNTAAGTTNFMDVNAAVIDDTFLYVYGWNGSSYTIYNQTTDAFAMAPGQAFWVAAENTTATALNFTAAMRSTTGSGDFVLGPQPLTYNVELILKDESQTATTNFYFKDGLSLDLDPGYDAGAYNQSMALSTRLPQGNQETAFSINAMDIDAMQNTRVPLEIRQNAGQAFTISMADIDLPQDIYVYLEDTVNGTLTSLKEQDFELTAQNDLSGSDRFFIVFKSNSVLSSGDTLGIDALNVYKANTDSFVTIAGISPELEKLDVTLYSILGAAVKQTVLNTTTATQRVSTQGLASGLYIVQIKSGNQTTVKKVIIK